jgi:pimeloyl-ACP methyl ester carboxylesterase
VGDREPEVRSSSAGNSRVLEVLLAGPADGIALFSHHGTPGAAEMFDPLVDIGAERNLRHITYSRPGYGGSGRLEGRSVGMCAADVVAIADALGYDPFYWVSGSGGGPHSIALAALPDRVISAAAIATPAPVGAEGLDWTAGIGEENMEELAATQGSDHELPACLERQAQSMFGTSSEEFVTALGDVVCEVDRRPLSGALREFMVRELAHSLLSRVWGWFEDDRAILGDGGFDLDDIRAPLSLWHSADDRFVPMARGQWLAEHTGATAELRPDEVHLSLAISSYGEILDGLLGQTSARQ